MRAGSRSDRTGSGALQVGGGLGLLRRINAGIDLVERLALPDDRAFPEQAALDDTGDLRPDIGNLVSRDAARKLLLKRSAAFLNDDEADLGWSTRTAAPAAATLRPRRASAAAASGKQKRSYQNGAETAAHRGEVIHSGGQFR